MMTVMTAKTKKRRRKKTKNFA